MQVTTVDVISANGKITKGRDAHAHSWASDEDWEHFQTLRDTFDLIVMGSRTYDIVHPRAEPARLRVVLTSRPQQYAGKAVPGQLEFPHVSPEELIGQMERRGFMRMLLVGGAVNTSFWERGLVNEAYITVEPILFGKGRSLVDDANVDASLRLIEVQQISRRGTVMLHYGVDKTVPQD